MSDVTVPPPRTRRRTPQEPVAVQDTAPDAAAAPPQPAPPAPTEPSVPNAASPAFPTRRASIDGLRDALDMDAAALDALMRGYMPQKGASLPRQGQRVRGTVSRVTSDTVFVDLGHKADAAIERIECDADVAPGSIVEAWVLNSKHGELRLTRSLAGADAREMLEEAAAARIPVQGKVVSANDHGVGVQLAGGTRAFCPLSHLAPAGTPVDTAALVGQTLAFHVLEVRGREAVVSHRAIAEEESRAAQAAAFATVQEGEVHEGTIVTIREFGAFVRLTNGAEGLVHLSNLARKRVEKVEDVVTVGQNVRVKVLKVDAARKRLDLGIKQADETGGADAPRGRTADPALRSGDPSLGSFGALLAGVNVRKR
jgi:ribosomal protein S1